MVVQGGDDSTASIVEAKHHRNSFFGWCRGRVGSVLSVEASVSLMILHFCAKIML